MDRRLNRTEPLTHWRYVDRPDPIRGGVLGHWPVDGEAVCESCGWYVMGYWKICQLKAENHRCRVNESNR